MNGKTASLASLALLLACAAPSSGPGTDRPVLFDTGSPDTGEEVIQPPPFAPADGHWTIQSKDVTLDPCEVASKLERGQAGSTYSINNTGELGFDIQYGTDSQTGTGGEIQSCTIDEEGLSFTCDPISYGEDLQEEHNLNAVILIDLRAEGVFTDENDMLLANDVDLNCTGDDCWLVEFAFKAQFPCQLGTEVSSLANDPVGTD
jgi:hypothetical protein